MVIKEQVNSVLLSRKREMHKELEEVLQSAGNNNSHYTVYSLFGIPEQDGKAMDLSREKRKIIYKYINLFIKDIVTLCFEKKGDKLTKDTLVKNSVNDIPLSFPIDFIWKNFAINIKWVHLNNDKIHLKKEHAKIQSIKSAGLSPIRLLLFYNESKYFMETRNAYVDICQGAESKCLIGKDAWDFIHKKTGIDLLNILKEITAEEYSMLW